MTHVQQERRRAPRAKADFPIHIADASGTQPATLKDISSNGLCCTFPQALAEMTLLAIDLEVPGGSGTQRMQGVVVRCDKLRGGPALYEVAIYFTEVPAPARQAIAEFVQRSEKKQAKR